MRAEPRFVRGRLVLYRTHREGLRVSGGFFYV